MWIMICGPDATGKTVAANLLVKDRFTWLTHGTVTDAPGFPKELRYASYKLATQLEAQAVMNNQDVITVRSFWECAEVFAKVAREREEITSGEYELLRSMHDALVPVCQPPHAIVYVRPDKKMMALDRMLLKTGRADEEGLRLQLKFYEDFISRIKVPLIEVEVSSTPEQIKERLEFDVASLRATRVSDHTLWKRELYKS